LEYIKEYSSKMGGYKKDKWFRVRWRKPKEREELKRGKKDKMCIFVWE